MVCLHDAARCLDAPCSAPEQPAHISPYGSMRRFSRVDNHREQYDRSLYPSTAPQLGNSLIATVHGYGYRVGPER
jgi:hypothetical protein